MEKHIIQKREDRERLEHEILSDRAAFADKTVGRIRPISSDEFRTCYQRDRDRIIHCKSFRRLSHKTQVFLAPEGDHYRTRLTHTLEVAQISRTIARALALNEDLTEAIALGHDLGHTPFGHTGEEALSNCIRRRRATCESSTPDSTDDDYDDSADVGKIFRHNEQSLRVVDVLENDGAGLNLTAEVRDGIVHHTGKRKAATLEGRIVATADRIAYVNHDIDDAIRAGLIDEEDLPQSPRRILGSSHSARITTLVEDMADTSAEQSDILLSPEIAVAFNELRDFLFATVYTSPSAKSEVPKAVHMLEALFEYYIDHTDEIPADIRRIAVEHPSPMTYGDCDCTAVVDYIAGMTDRFARSTFEDIYIPRNWRER